MERLTKRLQSGAADYAVNMATLTHPQKNVYRQKCVDRLAAYEDTGLEPEEVKRLNEEVESRFLLWVEKNYGISGGKLMELAKAQDEGLLVALPCMVGDALYSLYWNIKTEQYDVRSGKVKNVRYDSADDTVTVSDGEYLRVLGKTVFLTRTEAEAALQKGGPRETDPF